MDKDKEIDEYMEFRRGLNKLSATPIKSSDYVSPLESDKMVVKGGTLLPEARTIIKGGNPSIKTN